MNIQILKEILTATDSERSRLIIQFQQQIWNEEAVNDPRFEILSDLAYDLDFYEPDESRRIEDYSYYGDERLRKEIISAIKKLERLQDENVK